MQKQRPPRGQAWPWVRSLPWIRSFQLDMFRWSVSNHLYFLLSLSGSALRALHLFMTFINLLIFCCFNMPRGTQWMGTICQPNFRFPVWAFCGAGPHKNCSHFFRIFGKNSMSKKSKIFSFDFGSKTMWIDVIWPQRYGKTVFLIKKKFYKIFDFWT